MCSKTYTNLRGYRAYTYICYVTNGGQLVVSMLYSLTNDGRML